MPASVPVTPSLEPVKAAAFGYDQARHLLLRAGFGGTPVQCRLLAEWGPEKSVDHLLNFASGASYPEPRPGDFKGDIMRPPTAQERDMAQRARRSQDEDALAKIRVERQNREREDRDQARDMQRWWLKRMIETPRPLEEKMTLFWHGHFATSYRTIENSYHQFQQNQLFRAGAVGSFADLLLGVARDPAMIKYLNNDESRKDKPNENLAREIMELFSLGAGNYTERDIKEGARALTGYSFDYNSFVFRAGQHDDGVKTILGQTGRFNGDDFVRIILAQPACSQYIAAKLYRFFVCDMAGDQAPGTEAGRIRSGVVNRLAAQLASNNYQLRPMLRTLFLSEHFYDAANTSIQIKSPVELIVGAVRSLGTPVRDLGILNDALALMGQELLFPPNVAGWAGGRSWINTSTVFVRQNILNFLITGKTPRGYDPLSDVDRYGPTALLEPLAKLSPGAEKDPVKAGTFLLRFTLGGEASSERIATLTDFFASAGGVNPASLAGALCLISTMPEFQLC